MPTAALDHASTEPTAPLTAVDRDSIDQYLREVGRGGLLTPDEETALGVRIRAGDEAAIGELATRNLRFVVSVAKKYQNRGVALGDLIGEGNVGLLIAAQRFDPALGVRFISYAVWWIRQSIYMAIAHQSSIVRVPLSRTTGAIRMPDVSLDAPLSEDGDQSLLDRLTADDDADGEGSSSSVELGEQLQKALALLPLRDARILRLHFGLEGGREHTLLEIGSLLGVTQERVRHIRDRALRRLRASEPTQALSRSAA